MYAIIVAGGKQYKVAEGDTIYIEKLEAADGETVSFDNVLAVEKDGAMTLSLIHIYRLGAHPGRWPGYLLYPLSGQGCLP